MLVLRWFHLRNYFVFKLQASQDLNVTGFKRQAKQSERMKERDWCKCNWCSALCYSGQSIIPDQPPIYTLFPSNMINKNAPQLYLTMVKIYCPWLRFNKKCFAVLSKGLFDATFLSSRDELQRPLRGRIDITVILHYLGEMSQCQTDRVVAV